MTLSVECSISLSISEWALQQHRVTLRQFIEIQQWIFWLWKLVAFVQCMWNCYSSVHWQLEPNSILMSCFSYILLLGHKGFHFVWKTDEITKNHPCENIYFWRNSAKSPVLKCKSRFFFIILLWNSANFHHCFRIHLIATVVYINQWIIINILNVDITGFVSLTVLMMSLVTL